MRHFPIALLLSLTASAADWPMYLGNLAHTSYAPDETQITTANVALLQPLWRVSTRALIASSVTISGRLLLYGDWHGNFNALDATTGAQLWSTFVGKAPAPQDPGCMPSTGVSGQGIVSGNLVFVPGGDAAVYALDTTTGQIVWRTPLADPEAGNYLWSSIVLSGNSLYLGIASLGDCPVVRGALVRIPLADPQHPVSTYFAPASTVGGGVWTTPAIDEANKLIYVTTGNADGQDADNGLWGSALLALDSSTLEVRSWFWLPVTEEEADADWGSSPTLIDTSDGDHYVAANGKNGSLYLLHRPDLTLVWPYVLARDCDAPELGCGSISTPAFDGTVLYSGAGQAMADGSAPGAVFAFDPLSHNLLWTYPARGPVLAPVTVVPGLVFVPTLAGLAAIDAATGAELWTDQGPISMYSQAVVANGILYATYVNGDVAAWTAPPLPPTDRRDSRPPIPAKIRHK